MVKRGNFQFGPPYHELQPKTEMAPGTSEGFLSIIPCRTDNSVMIRETGYRIGHSYFGYEGSINL